MCRGSIAGCSSWGFIIPWLVSIGAIVLGFGLGVMGGLARVSRNVIARELATLYVEVFRGTPLLVQIYVFYFCIAAAVHFDNAVIIGMVTLAFFSGSLHFGNGQGWH